MLRGGCICERRYYAGKRMDYNQQEVIGGAKNDIRELGRRYPRHAKEIAAQVDRFTEKMERMEMPVTMSRGEASA